MKEIYEYTVNNLDMLLELILIHMELSFLAVFIACLIGIPSGILFTRYEKISTIGLNFISVLYTIPSLALFGLMIPIIGMGTGAAITALVIYSLMPIIQNVYTGIKNVDPNITEAAKGTGMSPTRILFTIELPLATTVILAGLRTALVNSIGVTTIAAYIGASGLGVLVFRGLSSVSPSIIIVGSVPVLLLAIVSDYAIKMLENRLSVDYMVKRRLKKS